MEIAYHSRPLPGQAECGDDVAVAETDEAAMVVVIDGLGHGREARKAAVLAKETALEHAGRSTVGIIDECHAALRSTRGAAVGVMKLGGGRGTFAGVGNIAVRAVSERAIHLISYAGIVGHKIRKVREMEFAYSPGDLICMHSDGVSSNLSLDGLELHDLEGSAVRIVEAYGKDHDDATVVLIRC